MASADSLGEVSQERASPPIGPVRIPAVLQASYPARDGNLLRSLIDGVPAFERICRAIESAEHSVWSTIAFLHPTFTLPGGRGALFDLFDLAAERGVDVRLLCWRNDPETAGFGATVFAGSADQREMLAARGSPVQIRWDRAAPGFCQHQKSWLIDAGRPEEVAFVGGINCNPTAMTQRHHPEAVSTHDAYLELVGPSVVDVQHNFVQRWNDASERGLPDGCWPPSGNDDLPFPSTVGPSRGTARVQIQRTVHPGRINDPHPAPGAPAHPIGTGETTILRQYLSAVERAGHAIYLENQYLSEPAVLAGLTAAVGRGVQLVALVPTRPEGGTTAGARAARAALAGSASTGQGDFLLAGLTGRADPVDPAASTGEQLRDIYVHDKLMIVDDEWVTIGSANLHRYSLHGNAELNAAVWDPDFARQLRVDLFAEHLDEDTAGLTMRAACALFRDIATANSAALAGDHSAPLRGRAIAIDPQSY